jgi:hypothetical protein
MKTWTLVWFLVFPPNDDGLTTWEYSKTTDLTQSECFAELAELDMQYRLMAMEGLVSGHEIYCKEEE